MKTDDFVLELRQPKTEPLGGGVELVDYITGVWWVWCLCAHLLCMCVCMGEESSVFDCVRVCVCPLVGLPLTICLMAYPAWLLDENKFMDNTIARIF